MTAALTVVTVLTYERDDTTLPHPLWSGDPETYRSDQAWRRDIPKAPSDCMVHVSERRIAA